MNDYLRAVTQGQNDARQSASWHSQATSVLSAAVNAVRPEFYRQGQLVAEALRRAGVAPSTTSKNRRPSLLRTMMGHQDPGWWLIHGFPFVLSVEGVWGSDVGTASGSGPFLPKDLTVYDYREEQLQRIVDADGKLKRGALIATNHASTGLDYSDQWNGLIVRDSRLAWASERPTWGGSGGQEVRPFEEFLADVVRQIVARTRSL